MDQLGGRTEGEESIKHKLSLSAKPSTLLKETVF